MCLSVNLFAFTLLKFAELLEYVDLCILLKLGKFLAIISTQYPSYLFLYSASEVATMCMLVCMVVSHGSRSLCTFIFIDPFFCLLKSSIEIL